MGLGLSLLASTADLASELATVDAVLTSGGDAALLKKALNMGEGSLQMGVLDGRAELRQNATDAARSLVERRPRDVHARWALAVGLGRSGDQEAAASHFEAANKLPPPSLARFAATRLGSMEALAGTLGRGSSKLSASQVLGTPARDGAGGADDGGGWGGGRCPATCDIDRRGGELDVATFDERHARGGRPVLLPMSAFVGEADARAALWRRDALLSRFGDDAVLVQRTTEVTTRQVVAARNGEGVVEREEQRTLRDFTDAHMPGPAAAGGGEGAAVGGSGGSGGAADGGEGAVDGGPWECREEGCPEEGSVGCELLAAEDSCGLRFDEVWGEPPTGVVNPAALIASACPVACGGRRRREHYGDGAESRYVFTGDALPELLDAEADSLTGPLGGSTEFLAPSDYVRLLSLGPAGVAAAPLEPRPVPSHFARLLCLAIHPVCVWLSGLPAPLHGGSRAPSSTRTRTPSSCCTTAASAGCCCRPPPRSTATRATRRRRRARRRGSTTRATPISTRWRRSSASSRAAPPCSCRAAGCT